jgi:acetyl esterase/lipase
MPTSVPAVARPVAPATLAVAAIVAVACAACAPRVAAERVALGAAVGRSTGLRYGEAERQRLDVYRPRRERAGSRGGEAPPTIVFLYGGRWKAGERRDYLLLANTLVRRGWVVVVPDYRLHPQVLFPAWVEDGARAVRWTVDHVGRFGGDPGRIVLVGHSAGAHTATLLALDERYLREAGVPAGAVRGVISIAGPVDTVWTAPDVQRLMGPEAGWPASYPTTHVDGDAPPLLLLHGGGDETVHASNSVRLAERIRARGGCARARVYRGVGHIQIVVALALPFLGIAPVLDDLARFVRDPAADACPDARRPAAVGDGR